MNAIAESPADRPAQGSAAHRVFVGVLRDLEHHRLIPGQRLIESELAERFGVGRNAVREGLQALAARGVVAARANHSSQIRRLDSAEIAEVMDVAEAMTGLAASLAARHFATSPHADGLRTATERLSDPDLQFDGGKFGSARRGFYRALLAVGGNRELARLFPAIGFPIIYAQFQSPRLRDVRIADYRTVFEAVAAGQDRAAERAARQHVRRVHDIIRSLDSD